MGRAIGRGPRVILLNGEPMGGGVPSQEVSVRTPATMGNFGPGFDVISLALAWGGDTVTARVLEGATRDEVEVTGPGASGVPLGWDENTAALGFEAVRSRLGVSTRVHLRVEKGVPGGSGLGSSASSAAGGVLAAMRLFAPDQPGSPRELLQAALSAESGGHGDDVAAALLGGLAMVRAGDCMRWDPPRDLAVAIMRPDFDLPTKMMRGVLPKEVPMMGAVGNLAELAFLLHAWSHNDAEGVARCLSDHLAAPHRRSRIPFFEVAEEAAISAGAPGIAISGSGPSLFTVTPALDEADNVAGAMAEAVRESGVEAEAIACLPESRHVWREALE